MAADLTDETPEQQTRNGLIAALVAYCLWGVLPVYFVAVRDVDTLEVLVHRIIWAVPFGAAIIHLRHQWGEVRRALTHPAMLAYLAITALLIAGNWLVYILAVQRDQIFQASLGYYINPLLFAVAGVFLMGEELRRPQALAVSLAAIGVLVLTFSGGRFPAIALFLGTSFTIYGIIRKKVVIGGMPGLFVETLVLLVPAVVYLSILAGRDAAVSDLASFAIVDTRALAEVNAHRDDRTLLDDDALDNLRACTDEAVVFDNGRSSLHRFEYAADAHATR